MERFRLAGKARKGLAPERLVAGLCFLAFRLDEHVLTFLDGLQEVSNGERCSLWRPRTKKESKVYGHRAPDTALGIGANAAIFGVVSVVLVRHLPIRDPQNVVVVHDQFPTLNLPRTTVSVLQFRDFSHRTDLFQSAAALQRKDLTLTGQGETRRIQGMEATSKLFSLLGVRPELGREFTSQDGTYGSAPAARLSHGLWQRVFGSDRAIVGRELRLDAKSYEIIGGLPKELETLYHIDHSLALGLGIALLLKPLIASQLFGVQVFDKPAFTLASALLLVTAPVAVFVPANRSMRCFASRMRVVPRVGGRKPSGGC